MSFDPLESITNRIAKTMYVVLLKAPNGKLTLLKDPGLSKPWSINGPNPIRNKRVAEFMAKDCDGMAATWEDAFRILRKENPAFEKELYDKLEHKYGKPKPSNPPGDVTAN